MNISIKLSNNEPTFTRQINFDNPYLEIIGLKIKGDFSKHTLKEIYDQHLQVSYNIIGKSRSIENNNINIGSLIRTDTNINEIMPYEEVLVQHNEFRFNKVEFQLVNNIQLNFEVELILEDIYNIISIEYPSNSFKNHLDENDNSKILFSAPFGAGKTTFLNYFFEENTASYEVFKLYPVNYSVSPNEDIFQYIKAEILFQLMAKNIPFDKVMFSKKYTIPAFIQEHWIDMLLPLIRLIPMIGGNIQDAIKDMIKIGKDYLIFEESIDIDDQKIADAFLKKLNEMEGSIYESNLISQIIRQLIDSIKKTGKKVVLVIDDLDRMDPGHILRILNVFAAHFDDKEYYDGCSNKFGFDKIILVTDVDNLKYIFAHFYGTSTSFDGYTNKFYSKRVFSYCNTDAINEFINETWPSSKHNHDLLRIILNGLNLTNNITLRELIKLGKSNYDNNIPNILNRWVNKQYYPIMNYLVKAFGIETLINKLTNCVRRIKEDDLNINYDLFSRLVLAAFVDLIKESNTKYFKFNFNDLQLSFEIKEHSERVYIAYNVIDLTNSNQTYKFNSSDFYSLILKLVYYYEHIPDISFGR
jgi:hypothetical protein